MTNILQVNSAHDLIYKYDGFILDLWGVIHDGVETYPGVIEALKFLKENNKTIVFLSNAPRRNYKVVNVLKNLGIDEDLYDAIVTSGQTAYEEIIESDKKDKNYYILGPAKDDDLLFDIKESKKVDDPKDADYAIVTGFKHDSATLADEQHNLENIAKYDLELLCINPDKMVVRLDGTKALCAGVLAKEYEILTRPNKVTYYGKPYKAVYKNALKYFKNIDKSKIVALGDSLDNDIKGANDFGIDNYLVTGGILSDIFKDELTLEKISDYCKSVGIVPNGVMERFGK